MRITVEERLRQTQPLFAQVWQSLAGSLEQAGIDQRLAVAGTSHSHCELREDPFDHSLALYCEWRGARGDYQGSILVYPDGLVFAEFDVLLAHPRKSGWVIEAATAWGYAGALKSELRLLPALAEA